MNVGCAGKTVRSLENACHTWVPLRCVHDKAPSTFTLPLPYYNVLSQGKWILLFGILGYADSIGSDFMDASGLRHPSGIYVGAISTNRNLSPFCNFLYWNAWGFMHWRNYIVKCTKIALVEALFCGPKCTRCCLAAGLLLEPLAELKH